MIGFVHYNQTTNTFSVLRALITTIFVFDSLVIKPFRIDLGHIFKISLYIGTNLVPFLNEKKMFGCVLCFYIILKKSNLYHFYSQQFRKQD